MTVVVDSSGWLEYLADAPNADHFAEAIESPEHLIVPTISIYEVFKRVLQQRNEGDALQAVALMHQGNVVDLRASLQNRKTRRDGHLRSFMVPSLLHDPATAADRNS